MSEEFCVLSQYGNGNDCELIQFILGITEETIDGIDYFFISYGINDCLSVIVKVEKQFIVSVSICIC